MAYLWLRLLAQSHRNLCCVGDDDQSIYSWRGAEVANILRFEKDFPGARIIRLERNYRSTAHILGAASGLIAHNAGRLGKTLWTDPKNSGEKVMVQGVWDGDEEARVVGEQIETLRRNGERLAECAVLVRAGFQTRAFEERFIAIGLPYRVVGGLRFYERQEIRDAIAYMRVTVQPDNDLAFERIVNLPKRGLGVASLRPVYSLARAQGLSLARAAALIVETDELRPGDSVVSSPETAFDLAGIYPLKMQVVGVLEPNFTPDDHAVFVDIKTAWIIEGLGHGHQDLAQPEAASGVLNRTENNIVANASVVQFNEISESNIDTFHFHGDLGVYPLTAVIALPQDQKSGVILMGRYVDGSATSQILRPRDVVDELLATILTIQQFIVAAVIIVAIATIATAALVFLLSLRLRRREIDTIGKIGGGRWHVASMLLTEIIIVLILSGGLATVLTVLTWRYGSTIIESFVLS